MAYATNGDGVRLRDLAAGTETEVGGYLTPVEAWARYCEVNDLGAEQQEGLAQSFNRELLNADGSPKEPRDCGRALFGSPTGYGTQGYPPPGYATRAGRHLDVADLDEVEQRALRRTSISSAGRQGPIRPEVCICS